MPCYEINPRSLLFSRSPSSVSASRPRRKADRKKPMNLEAVAYATTTCSRPASFTGRVVVTGHDRRPGARDDPAGPRELPVDVVAAEPGKLAFFRQKREGVDEFVEGESEVIEYDGKADRVSSSVALNCAGFVEPRSTTRSSAA